MLFANDARKIRTKEYLAVFVIVHTINTKYYIKLSM